MSVRLNEYFDLTVNTAKQVEFRRFEADGQIIRLDTQAPCHPLTGCASTASDAFSDARRQAQEWADLQGKPDDWKGK